MKWVSTALNALLAALLLGGSAQAQLLPQWSREFTGQSYLDDVVVDRRSWSVSADGGTALATLAADGVVLRRYDPSGLRFENSIGLASLPRTLGHVRSLLLATDDGADALYLAINGGTDASPGAADICVLLRVDAQGVREWAQDAPDSASGAGACVDMAVAADGSLLLLREGTLARVMRNGSGLWYDGNVRTHNAHRGRALLIDAQQRVVLSTQAGSTATIQRRGLDGSPQGSYHVPNDTTPSKALGLDLLPNGEVVVAGQMDLPGAFQQTGYVSALDPAGGLRLLHSAYTDTPFLRTTHDAAGTIYVQTGADSVRALAPADAALRWERPGREMAASAAGVVLVDPAAAGAGPTTLTALSVDGAQLWTQSLDSDRQAAVYGGDSSNGGSRLLLQPGRSTDCGNTPLLLTLDASGSIAGRLQSCRLGAGSQAVYGLSAHAGAGVLAGSVGTVSALDEHGALRWSFSLCPYCTPLHDFGRPVASQLLADGSAWLLHRDGNRVTLRRMNADGTVAAAIDLPSQPDIRDLYLVAGTDDAIVVLGSADSLRWVRANASGMLGMNDFALAGGYTRGTGFVGASPRLADGSLVLAYRREPPCGFPTCGPRHVTLLRIGNEGGERWRQEFANLGGWPRALFNADGSALLLEQYASPAALRFIGSQGGVGVRRTLGFDLRDVIGPSQGRFLARGAGNDQYIGDQLGTFSAVSTPFGGEQLIGHGAQGFLVGARQYGSDAVLLDPQLLVAKASFDTDGIAYNSPEYPSAWHMLDDGSIYASWNTGPPSDGTRYFVSRFTIPGTAAERIFADGFD